MLGMNSIRRNLLMHRAWLLALFMAMLMVLPHWARAADYAAGVDNNAGTVTLWFKSNVNTSWVNAHFNVNGGAQLNVVMTLNSSKARFETNVSASAGQAVNFAFTYDNGGPAYDSPWGSATVPPVQDPTKVATPGFSLASGTYGSAQNVTVSSATAGATLLCSINGGAQGACPNPIAISQSTSVSAIATKSGLANSDTATASYTISTVTGPYSQGVTDDGSSATIWFASDPASAWVDVHYAVNGGGQQNVRMNAVNGRNEQTVAVTAGAPLAIVYSFTYMTANGALDSAVFNWSRSSAKVQAPMMSPAPGTYAAAQTLSFTSATAGAAICVTTDGSTPVKGSNCSTGTVTVSASTTTVKALAYASGMSDSDVVTGVYQVQCCVAAPSISPAGGSYGAAQAVTLASATTGATIYYTLDGSTPNAASNLYSGPFFVSSPGATVNAIAMKSGLSTSTIASAAFTISLPQVSTPTFTPPGGSYSTTQSVHLGSATAGASIFYSVNGSAQSLYSDASPLSIAANSTITAVAKMNNMADSANASASYAFAACSDCFGYGVAEDGSTAKVWFAPGWTPTTAISHFYVTSSSGAKSPQRDETMTYNGTINRWESPTLSSLAQGDVVSFAFTYSAPTGGNKDTPWYQYTICGDVPDSPQCPSPVAKPVFSITGGVYSSARQVSLALAAGVDSSAQIYYTIDGSAPSTASTQYAAGHPIAVNTAMTINAITVLPNQMQSRRASETYDIALPCAQTVAGCSVAAPQFSHASGVYSTVIGVNLLSATTGATVHYTIDGSIPSATSPQFNGAIWMRNTAQGATTTLKAIATKDGQDSAVVERTYTISANNASAWNGMTTFNIINGTQGKYSDAQVYWLIIGMDWATGQFVHVDATGKLVPMSLGDNTVPVPNRPTGYANYALSLAQAKSLTIPPIQSARIYMSVGKPVLIQVNSNDLGKITYAGPDLNNSTDPNLGVTFDFGEFNINQPRPQSDMPGIFVNTSRVDIFGFPLQLNVTGLDGYNATVGESLTETRDELFARFNLEVPSEFRSLAQAPYAPYRIMSPAHGSFDDGIDVKTGTQARPRGANATYLDDYISSVWNQYRSQDLVLNLQNGWPTFTGRVDANDTLTFTDSVGSYHINGKPSTTEVMLGNGLLDDASGTADKLAHDKQLQLQAQVCAALNRHVADQAFGSWWDGAHFYPAGQAANYFTKFWHRHSLNGLAYGFSYDDVGGHSPSIYTPSPVAVTFTIGQ
jgi:hypothetical protein